MASRICRRDHRVRRLIDWSIDLRPSVYWTECSLTSLFVSAARLVNHPRKSNAVEYRSARRLPRAIKQIRSSSLGIDSSYLSHGPGVASANLFHDGVDRFASKGQASGQQFIKDYSKTKHIAATIDSMAFTASLFGTHVRWCANKFGPKPQFSIMQRFSPKSTT